jgi:UDP-GlcNAc:undecaprenyl-phosphate GlcNAc-1-phosphate transferase
MPLFRGDARHIHHRLLDRGYSKRTVIAVLYGICLTLSMGGLVIFWTQGLAAPIVAAALFAGLVLLGRSIGIGGSWHHLKTQVSQAARWRGEIKRSHRMGEYLMSELEHCHSSTEFWRLFDEATCRLGFVGRQEDDQLDIRESQPGKVVVRTQGNPALCLFYPEGIKERQNWWGLADCLYPAYAAAKTRWQTTSLPRRQPSEVPHRSLETPEDEPVLSS